MRETTEVTKNRKATTDWTNAFGARHYQPHIKLLQPGSGVDRDLARIHRRDGVVLVRSGMKGEGKTL